MGAIEKTRQVLNDDSSAPGEKLPVGLEAVEIPLFKHIPKELLSLVCASVSLSVK